MFKLFKSYRGLKKALLNNTGKEKIIFYSESKNYRNYFHLFLKEILKSKKFYVQYITSDINDSEEFNGIKPIYIGKNLFLIIFFNIVKCKYFIMTLTNLGNYHLKKNIYSKYYVYVFHSIVSTHKCYEKKSFINYDIIFSLGEYQKNELIKAEKIYNLPKKKIYTVGYFYTFQMLNKIKFHLANKKHILFAPSWNKSKKNLFNDYSLIVISKLLSSGFFVTLRAHPELLNRSNDILNKIKTKFLNNKNFFLNLDLTDLSSFEKSAIIVTDDGGVGIEFAYILKRPVLFLNYIKKIHNHDYQELDIKPIEESFSLECAYNLDVKDLSKLDTEINNILIDSENKISKYDNFFEKYGLTMNHDSTAAKKAAEILNNKIFA